MGDGDELKRSSSSHRVSSGGSGPSAANAEARMKLASVDALSELVWSPRNGLSLRCADFSFTGKVKLLSPNIFDIGQTNMALRHSNTTEEEEEEEVRFHHVDVQLRTQEQVNQEMNRPLSGIGGSVEDMKPEREEIVEDNVETNDDKENQEAGCSKRSLGSPRAGSQEEPTNRGDKEEEEEDKMNNRLDRLESMDENNLTTLAVVACEGKEEYLPEDETDVEKAGPSVSFRRRDTAKGKEKALSDGNYVSDKDKDEDDESFGSVESCNSAGLLLRGKKRPGFEHELILGSKRVKTLNRECLGSTSKLKQDSSFMNWISNMTKGIWNGNEEDNNTPFVALTNTTSNGNGQVNVIVDQPELSLKENKGCRNTGFQSFFQSIYCPKKQDQDAVEMDLPSDANAASMQELPWITKEDHLSSSGNGISLVAAEPNISTGKVEMLSSENKHEDNDPNIFLLSLSKPKSPNEEQKVCGEADGKVRTNRNSRLDSLWISRFSSKSSFPQVKANEAAKEANDSASDAAKEENVIKPGISTVGGFNIPNTTLPILSSLRIESSDAMASLFARRLEAMKRIMTSSGSLADNAEEKQTDLICFYCGKKSHRIQDCLEVTDTELRDLVQNLSARNGREEASSLCIRCFQLSHWAATCPNAPLYSSGAEDRAMKHALASTSGSKLPLSGFADIPKTVFDSVQVLRLTRTDVLKWINTKKSVSGLEGFFLRLRLGKWEEGLGGTGYYVARIDGDTEGQSSKIHTENNNSIPVKVKGMTCFVESQFISNQDFLEEELKAWWRSAGKSGGGGEGVPSAEELSRKIHQRKMLGF